MALLEIDAIHVFYDKIEALKGISLAVEERQVVTLVGGNGAGKSTTLRAISGLLHPRQGTIRFDGRSLAGLGAHEIAATGVVHVPEGRRIFGRLTVSENRRWVRSPATTGLRSPRTGSRCWCCFRACASG